MPYPANIRELVEHLERHPRVRMACPHPRVPVGGDHSFIRLEGGLAWFRSDDGREHHLPLECGMAPSESGLEFVEGGFRFTKFGIPISVTYLEDLS